MKGQGQRKGWQEMQPSGDVGTQGVEKRMSAWSSTEQAWAHDAKIGKHSANSCAQAWPGEGGGK